jgi:Rad3-related DNA helicase
MIAPRNARELAHALDRFRDSPSPAILISPAITTGYDFAYSQCEYSIVVKMPFADSRSPIMAARAKADPEYIPYLTAQTLVQSCGRGMRAADDQCETLVLDGSIKWFSRPQDKKGFRHLLPSWFIRQLVYADRQPEPLPPLSL